MFDAQARRAAMSPERIASSWGCGYYGGAGGPVGGDEDRMSTSTVNVSPLAATATAL